MSLIELEPKDFDEKLEFDKIKELLHKECLGELGKEVIDNLQIFTDLAIIQQKLNEVNEYKTSMEKGERFPISAYTDISEHLKMLEIIDYVLPIEGLQQINIILLSVRGIVKFFTPIRKDKYATLYNIVRDISFDQSLIDAIDKVIDDKGNIKPDASPELMRIRKQFQSKRLELEKQFRSIINDLRSKGWLSDSVESFRNGRRVLSVPAEYKRKVRGIIHDESATGKTAFIEPEAIIDINNDIFDLEINERKEIYRILKELSALLRPYVSILRHYQTLIVVFDEIQAKAQLATKMEASRPKLKHGPSIQIIKGYHPLLLLKNKAVDRATIPFTLTFKNKNRLLVLSGPNAGGKSITMKSVGLMQLMVQSGMLVPVDNESEFGIFKKMFADIGDSQSLEDDLSTYSSRLQNMRVFLEKSDANSLILIDEFGSGTDPKIGGAIAEAILKELNKRELYGVITTHYSNLKLFAYKNEGIVNGSMTFNKDNLSPTYKLVIGRPGSSYAFEIAHKSGLSKQVLNYAKHKAGKNEKAVDDLLIDLQKEKKELEDRIGKMKDREKSLQKLIKNYENLHRDMEFKRKKMKLEAKEKSLQDVAGNNKDFEKLIREIREEKNLEKAQKLKEEVKKEREDLASSVQELREEIYYKPSLKEDKPFVVGDFVKLRTGGATGRLESINKKKAVVVMGLMKMTTKLRDLVHANEPIEIRKTKSVQTNMLSSSAKFESKIDLRGLRRDEALKMLENFVDKALMSNASDLRIIHGKGDGILRTAVKNKLREYNDIQTIRHPEDKDGGDGVTIVEIA